MCTEFCWERRRGQNDKNKKVKRDRLLADRGRKSALDWQTENRHVGVAIHGKMIYRQTDTDR
jgi:hypothetical protein